MTSIAKLRSIDPPADREHTAVPGVILGDCLDAEHPTLQGRARIRWTQAGTVFEQWLPMLATITIRPHDRVLLVQPSNHAEPVILGVLDGFMPRPVRPITRGPVLELKPDEAVRVQSRDGQELLELSMAETGPVVRLLASGVALNLPGELSISAERIALEARRGEVQLSASDDVVVVGATVRLN